MNKSIFTTFILILTTSISTAQKLLGGDISLLPSYEKQGATYKDSCGKQVDAMQLFAQQGWNAMRVRLFVDPSQAPQEHKGEGVCQDLNYVLGLSRQIKAAGMKLMLDLHYSDTWADPGKQFTPKRWEGKSAQVLTDSVYAYTREVLLAMQRQGTAPDLIQVGNEITFGMLWPTGRVKAHEPDNWDVLRNLINAGIKACRAVTPKARIIIHTEHAQDWATTKYYYEQIKQSDYDIIGLSYYPMWHEKLPILNATLDSLQTTFPNKEVMIVETAFYYSHDRDTWAKNNQYADYYPINPEGQRIFTKELVAELNRHKNVTGLFWWFPEENGYKNNVTKGWLNRGLFDNHTGRALPALYELKGFR